MADQSEYLRFHQDLITRLSLVTNSLASMMRGMQPGEEQHPPFRDRLRALIAELREIEALQPPL